MKYYIDISVIIALINEKDPNHEKAFANYPKDGERLVSKLVVIELYSVFFRTMKLSDEELDALVDYALNKCDCKVKDIELNKIFDMALRICNRVKLKTLDLLHLSASIIMGSEMISLDKELLEAKKLIENKLD
ncbi:type II toxin-antitoxin system VapC family toxin [Sulfolobus sp. S-194]|uniref:type II toxin-antitoxin system VapC family toxin n=1 Tax=Sulfolobus sp. S-194 TaxID=2512240 RepID=UPI0014371AA4|nr:PIN domain-containing protein [Sulfolobus sp. S-194]QIW22845.1 type II toxin-antitoxin system VapC family toxin [Sulfolobus sp. S-194]